MAESFLPDINGVTNSVLHVVEHLERHGHHAMVIAPGFGSDRVGDTPVERVPAVAVPLYRTMNVGLPTKPRVHAALAAFRPDVVHLAAPVVLGATSAAAAADRGIPAIAVFQTDVAGFAARYRLAAASPAIWGWLKRVHNSAALTLAPSTMAVWELQRRGIRPVARWGRGVDAERFRPGHRSEALRRRLAPRREVLVGYVGRLAHEKRVDLLAHVETLPGVRTVVVGDGPARANLERKLQRTRFLGFRAGAELSQLVASLDIFVHTGADETFCQAVQEALASGVPVVAPAAGGPLDLVQHGSNGFLYPPGEPELMREAVAALAADPALRARLGQQAHESVRGRSWSELGDELLDHYAAVIASGQSRAA